MKRVSFEIAMILKEAGYPQELNNKNEYYSTNIDKDNPDYEIVDEPFTPYSFETSVYEYYVAPTYLEAWLWLWRERKECIDIISAHNHDALVHINGELKGFNDPEEAIEGAIKHLVDNNLIK